MILGSGVDLHKFQPSKTKAARKQPVVVLFASRLLKSKGIDVFIEVAGQRQQLMEEFDVDLEFWVAGKFDVTNPECIEADVIAAAVKLRQISYLGEVGNMSSLIQKASILVLPTCYGEGLPKVLCEAASCAVPAIASDIPGCRQAIVDNETGFLIKEVNAGQFAMKIADLLGDVEKRQAMSDAARKHAEQFFGLDSITESHFKIYADG